MKNVRTLTQKQHKKRDPHFSVWVKTFRFLGAYGVCVAVCEVLAALARWCEYLVETLWVSLRQVGRFVRISFGDVEVILVVFA